jgi:hypothetical protein
MTYSPSRIFVILPLQSRSESGILVFFLKHRTLYGELSRLHTSSIRPSWTTQLSTSNTQSFSHFPG